MRKIYLTFCLFIFSIAYGYSQSNWVQQGATWYYDYYTFTNGGGYKIVYESDSTINSIGYKKIITYRNSCSPNPPGWPTPYSCTTPHLTDTNYVRFNGDTLYILNKSDTIDVVLYNFDLQVGDSTKYYVVDSIYFKNINGTNYRAQKVHATDTTNCFGIIGEVVELYGSNKFLFPFYYNPCCGNNPGICDGIDERNLNCYSDIQSNVVLNTNHACDYYFSVGLNQIVKDNSEITIYPNPASQNIEIKGLEINKECQIVILNNLGQKVYLFNNSNYLNVNDLLPGYYLIQIIQKQNVYTKSFIKL